MAISSFRRYTGASFLILFMLLVNVLQSQDLDESGDECNGCWGKLDEEVDRAARSIVTYYRHRAKNEWANEAAGPEEMLLGFQHSIFRRSTLPSSSLECDSCWMVLKRLRSYAEENSRSKEVRSFRNMVKKTMLNNGWV